MPTFVSNPHRWIRLGLMVLAAAAALGSTAAAQRTANHDLSVSLSPAAAQLEGVDDIHIRQSENDGVPVLEISPRADILSVRLDGREQPYRIDHDRLLLEGVADPIAGTLNLKIHYRCRFDDPAPRHPVNTDNPGYGVSGTITPQGTFILPGAGWYPRLPDAAETVLLRVEGPEGLVAVTSGRLLEIIHEPQRTVSRWRADRSPEGLSLSAGPFAVDQRAQDGMHAATFLRPADRYLAERYLAASLDYLVDYSDRFGDYAYAGFAVVENFFPTGYGFPAYTLMGGTVLTLPFIPHTSLPHEIVHNWWGNGVLVDFSTGNWCEGLATYTADYLIKEAASADAARDYRRQALRNYAALVPETADFALRRFRSRTNSVTKAIGYDKAAMVFHMLRREVGETAFWGGLRDLYRQYLFRQASWSDLEQVFEGRADRPLGPFFKQWVDRPGAPQLRLAAVRREERRDGYHVTGRLVQEKPYFRITAELRLETDDTVVERRIRLEERETGFDIVSRQPPRRLDVDPEYDLFRRLTASEMPPTVNTLKGSTSLVAIVADRLGPAGTAIANRLIRALGVRPRRTVGEKDFVPADYAADDLLFIGLPAQQPPLGPSSPRLAVDSHRFELAGQVFTQPSAVLFAVTRRSDQPGGIAALLAPLSPGAADRAATKIPHYGRYSYLAFSGGRNRIKGTWEIEDSPLIVRWDRSPTP